MRQETFLNYRSYKWLWINLIALVVLAVFYSLDHPVGGRNGGTVLGYTYGVLAALGIVYLMWFGIRKRSYYSASSTLKGWLAAHVWIGLTLLFLVPLHSGFSFGCNVHTLAYVLMALTIVSGIWGALNYSRLAPEIRSNRGGGKVEVLIEQILSVSREIDEATKSRSDSLLKLAHELDFEFKPSLRGALCRENFDEIERGKTAQLLESLDENERDDGLQLVGLINRKMQLCSQVHDETRVMFWLKVWLYFHLPVSIACLVTLVIHIIAVFYYW